MMNRGGVLTLVLVILSVSAVAQQLPRVPKDASIMQSKGAIICYGSGKNVESYLPPPKEYLERIKNPSARTQTASFVVVYDGFPNDNIAKNSFQAAVDIWASLIQSPVTINVLARWRSITSGTQGFTTLGQASWGNVYANFDGAPKLDIWYPAALAEKLAGKDLSSGAPNQTTADGFDIVATFNKDVSWNFTASTPQANKTHFTTVVLHELGHGLGFTDSFNISTSSGNGSYGVISSGLPIIFDASVESGTSRVLDQATNSAAMATTLTNKNITYNSQQATAVNGGQKPKLYAPNLWEPGSSIAHLDQTTFSGTANSLMKPVINNQEVALDPGSIVKSMFSDMGWQAPRIVHAALTDTETTNTPFTVSAIVSADGSSGYSVNSVVKLRYSINGAAEVEVAMTAGSGNLYTAQLPTPVITPTNYAYYIVVTDNLNRTFTKPGQFIRPGLSDQQAAFQFRSGPDTTVPVITHTPVDYILEGTVSLNVKATVTDNIGVQGVSLSYQINTGTFQNLSLIQDNDTLSLYKVAIPTSGLVDNDVINYRIMATDNSSNFNIANGPSSTTFYTVKVNGFLPVQDNYVNDFNSATTDFFGNGYTITTPAGFTNPAIHSLHPYLQAGNGKELNYIYQLKVPIKVKAQDATIKFDEIVLVEPGTSTVFPSADFFDYVVVEGSTDGGKNWLAFSNGYDSRDYTPWLTKYNSNIINDVSQGVGDPSLFQTRTINMLNKFKAGDEVVIRFRLFSDPGAAGWGWAIDNLKIQIDDSGPTVLHNHIDYVVGSTNSLAISADVTDASGIDKVFLDYSMNNGSITAIQMPLSATANTYSLNLNLSSLNITAANILNYRIRAIDAIGNSGQMPSSGFINVPRITLGNAQNSYVSDFNSVNTDFVGNFFSISTPTGFSNGAIHSSHPYPNGFGLSNSNSAFAFTLSKPILIDANNPYMIFDEIGIIEPINDYAIVEASKDNGATWKPFVPEYDASSQSTWLSAYNSKANGATSLFKSSLINLTQNGNFKSGDQVLIRFRLNANSTINAWGWAIDNLSIQGPITGLEKPTIENSFSIYPNPTNGSKVMVKFNTVDDSPLQLQVLSSQGNIQQSMTIQPVSKTVEKEFYVGDWANGLYIIKAEVAGSVITKKFIKTQ
ncbi:MAG: T9SS type A sorting domain-containing protein [Cyclobacteriaceae bacterium]